MECPFCGKEGQPTYDFCPHCKHEWIISFDKPEKVVKLPMNCPRCQTLMIFSREEELQRSSFANNFFFGEFGELFKGTFKLNMYVFPHCRKVEFELRE